MDYAKIALLVLQLAKWLIDKAEASRQFNAGAQSEIFKSTRAIQLTTQEGKRYAELVDRLTDSELDDLERDIRGERPK